MSLIRTLIPSEVSTLRTTSKPDHLPKAASPDTIALWGVASAYEFGEHCSVHCSVCGGREVKLREEELTLGQSGRSVCVCVSVSLKGTASVAVENNFSLGVWTESERRVGFVTPRHTSAFL